MRRIASLLAVLVIAGSAHAEENSETKKLAQYWKDTNLSLEGVLSKLSMTSCYFQEAVDFRACAEAISGISAVGNKPVVLRPTAMLQELGVGQEAVIKQFGSFSLIDAASLRAVEAAASKGMPRQQTFEIIRQRRDRLTNMMDNDVYPILRQQAINIATCLNDAQSRDRETVSKCMAPYETSLVGFADVARYVYDNYVKDLDRESFATGNGLNHYIRVLDGHAEFMSRGFFENDFSAGDKSVSGIGVMVADENGNMVVKEVVKGGAADTAATKSKNGGLKAGDKITGIISIINASGEKGQMKKVSGLSLQAVVDLMRGQENVKEVVEVDRNGKVLQFTIPRSKVVIKNVDVKDLGDKNFKINYIKLASFAEIKCSDPKDSKTCITACPKVKAALNDMKRAEGAERYSGVIFDVRGNPGGLLDAAACISGLFIGKKVVAQVRDLETGQDPSKAKYIVSEENALTNLPMVLLINAGSASASEIMAGALQDHKRAWLVGDRSWGKGSVQEASGQPPAFGVAKDDMIFKSTISIFYQPSGRTNQLVGIEPDFSVPMNPDTTADDRFVPREADLVPNAIPGNQSVKWEQTRKAEIANIQGCINRNESALKRWQAAQKAGTEDSFDYQLAKAEEVVQCAAFATMTKSGRGFGFGTNQLRTKK